MKNILICLEKLDIGGVETSVITQAKEYQKRGYKVIILSKKGIYTSILEKCGISCYEYDFKLEDRFFIEESKKIEEIINKEKITEVHIHQYPCIIHLLPILLKLNIPYIAFNHSIVDGVYEHYMNCYKTFKLALPLFFQKSSKIIVIREEEIKRNSELFNIDKSKYFLLKNSINFDEINISSEIPKSIKNYLLVSRISEEKLLSIKSGIKYFLKQKEKNKDINLKVIGDGAYLENIKKEFSDENITYIGKVSNVYDYIEKSDVVIGVDRCIIEAICHKKLAIISNYQGKLILVNPSNINYLSKENFSGNNITDNMIEKINLNKINYKKITTDNYKYAYKELNISNNIFDKKLEKSEYNNWQEIFNYSNLLNSNIVEEQQISKKLYLENQNLYKKINIYKEKLNQNYIRRIKNKIRKIINK